MAEHWSLVFSHRQDPDWNKFISENFQPISLDGAEDRLEKIVRSWLSKSELKSFQEIKKHRNKVAHFFMKPTHPRKTVNKLEILLSNN